VVDENGRPIAGAFFDHTDMDENEYAERFTNREGIFDIWTHAQRIILRKAGYASAIVHPEDTAKHKFKMNTAQSFPICPGSKPQSADPFDASLEFRRASEVVVVKTGMGADYTFTQYGIKDHDNTVQLRRVRSQPWFSTPNDNEVWLSVQYSERTYFVAGIEIVDARGITKEGKRWRELIRMYESLSYHDADPATAKLLDEFLDRTCLQLRP
jgi:hypothetical protein